MTTSNFIAPTVFPATVSQTTSISIVKKMSLQTKVGSKLCLVTSMVAPTAKVSSGIDAHGCAAALMGLSAFVVGLVPTQGFCRDNVSTCMFLLMTPFISTRHQSVVEFHVLHEVRRHTDFVAIFRDLSLY